MAVPFRPRPRPEPIVASIGAELKASTSSDTPAAATTPGLKVCYRPIGDLKPSSRNARVHPDKQLHKLGENIKKFRFNVPILIDEADEILAGHGRLEAARRLGMTEVPTICLVHMTAAEKRAYRIADNKLAEFSEWDIDILKQELDEIFAIDIELPDFTGFETAEIENILAGPFEKAPPKADPADVLPEQSKGPVVTRLHDIWLLGKHRIICGDARDAGTYSRLMGDELAQMVFTDPPFNVRIDGHAGGLGKTKHREFAMASGEMSEVEFTTFLREVFTQMATISADGSLHFTCIDWSHLYEMLDAGRAVFDELKNVITWAKTNGGMGSLYRSQHELIPLWKKGNSPHINNIKLGSTGRYRTNVWTYAGANTFRRGRMDDLESHPTVKPCALVMDAIKDVSKRGGIVLDPFGGSGTTLIAAEKTKRQARLIELDPTYVDLTIGRWQALTGEAARHAATGKTFEETNAERSRVAVAPTPEDLTMENAYDAA